MIHVAVGVIRKIVLDLDQSLRTCIQIVAINLLNFTRTKPWKILLLSPKMTKQQTMPR